MFTECSDALCLQQFRTNWNLRLNFGYFYFSVRSSTFSMMALDFYVFSQPLEIKDFKQMLAFSASFQINQIQTVRKIP